MFGIPALVGISVLATLSSCKSVISRCKNGEPLFLTPFIERGKWIEGQNAARVPSLIKGKYVESYAGYLTVNKSCDSNLFFWFFPAENSPSKAPLVLWLQGGPGDSSLIGTFSENGPFSVAGDLTLKRRSHYWSQELNVIYIDNPVGVGFSFTGKEACYPKDETAVGQDLYSAMVQFLQLFPGLRKNEFYITGESYAGKYIPALGYTIHERNPHAELKINLAGLAIGNGLVDPKNMLAYSDYLPQLGLIDDNAMLILKKLERNALDLINQEKFSDAADARIRILVMFQNISGLINVYDYTKNDNSSTNTLYSGPIGQYLNQTKVKRALHVGSKPFSNGDVPAAILHEDIAKSVAPWLVTLMENYRVMLYNGQLDIIVAYPLTVNFVKRLKWSGAEEYKNASRQIWYVDGKIAGYVKTAKNFTEVLVRNSGHMVPSDQPVWALDLITRFTRKIPFDQPLVGNRKRVRVTA